MIRSSVALAVLAFACSDEASVRTHPLPTADELLAQLEDDPNSCFINEQLGSLYQMQQSFSKSIDFYRASLADCPGEPHVLFKLGISTFLTAECRKGESIMNEAIDAARSQGDEELAASLGEELEVWLSKRSEATSGTIPECSRVAPTAQEPTSAEPGHAPR